MLEPRRLLEPGRPLVLLLPQRLHEPYGSNVATTFRQSRLRRHSPGLRRTDKLSRAYRDLGGGGSPSRRMLVGEGKVQTANSC